MLYPPDDALFLERLGWGFLICVAVLLGILLCKVFL